MSSNPTSDDEHPEVVDDGTLSEVVRRPTRTAGDLSEVADASAGITLGELLRRVRRMENEISELRESVRRIERNIRSLPVPRDTGSQGPVVPVTPSGPKSEPLNPTRLTPAPTSARLPRLKQDGPSEGES
jgi:hypothetical protein